MKSPCAAERNTSYIYLSYIFVLMKGLFGTFLLSSTLAATAFVPPLGGSGGWLQEGLGLELQSRGAAWQRCVEKFSALWWGTKSMASHTAQLNCKAQSHKVPVSSSHACPWDLGTLCNPPLVLWIAGADSIAQGTGFKFCKVLRLTFLSPFILCFSWPDPPSMCPQFQWEGLPWTALDIGSTSLCKAGEWWGEAWLSPCAMIHGKRNINKPNWVQRSYCIPFAVHIADIRFQTMCNKVPLSCWCQLSEWDLHCKPSLLGI